MWPAWIGRCAATSGGRPRCDVRREAGRLRGPVFRRVQCRLSSMLHGDAEPYGRTMSWLRRWWAQTAPTVMPAPSDSAHPDKVAPRTARDWSVDAGAFVIAAALGALILSVSVDDAANRMTSGRVATDAAFGALCCLSLWWRRRLPFGVALVCVLLGT